MKRFTVEGFPGREIEFNQRKYLYFGGTAYLGLQLLPEYQTLYISQLEKFGLNYGASRDSNVQLGIYEDAEMFLSNWAGSEACLTLSSGYLAGQLLASFFGSGKYKLYYSACTHSSLLTKERSRYNNYQSLRAALQQQLTADPTKTPVILLDSVDLTPDTYPIFKGLQSLPLESCVVIADDSHGFGLVGSKGEGVYKLLQELAPKELFVCCSLGKSLALQAGAIFGSATRISQLKNTALFAGSSPPAPALLATMIKAFKLYQKQRSILKERIFQFHSSLDNPEKLINIDGYPVYEYQDNSLTLNLLKNEICVTSFEYAADDNSLQNRIVISASHRPGDIEKLAVVINDFYR